MPGRWGAGRNEGIGIGAREQGVWKQGGGTKAGRLEEVGRGQECREEGEAKGDGDIGNRDRKSVV